jgi:hypothetical protein
MDGSGTINPAALNTPGMCFLYSPHTARKARFAVARCCRRRGLSLPQRCYIRHWRPHYT